MFGREGGISVIERDNLAVHSERMLTFSELVQLVHDFKGPLSLVALETQVLQSQLDDGDHVEMVDAITRVLLNIDYIDRMVHDLIDSCAMDTGHFSLHRRATEMCDLLENVTVRMAALDHGRIMLDARARVTLKIDALRIERVVANLLQNALLYSPDETQVLVKLDVSEQAVRVTVRDRGPGIPRDEIHEVFDQYRRGTAGHPHDGNGLGLFVSKEIVEAHGGRMGVESTPGLGSEFFFELPRT
jgi:K+-sensing histidine kinase KdpD